MLQSFACCCHNRFAGKSLLKILPDGVFGSSLRQMAPPLSRLYELTCEFTMPAIDADMSSLASFPAPLSLISSFFRPVKYKKPSLSMRSTSPVLIQPIALLKLLSESISRSTKSSKPMAHLGSSEREALKYTFIANSPPCPGRPAIDHRTIRMRTKYALKLRFCLPMDEVTWLVELVGEFKRSW
jgi:hypothetical protein